MPSKRRRILCDYLESCEERLNKTGRTTWRKAQQAVLEEKMKTSKEISDATSHHRRLMIEYDLEEPPFIYDKHKCVVFFWGFSQLTKLKIERILIKKN